MENRQITPNSNEPSSTPAMTQSNSRQFLQPDNSLDSFYNQPLRGSYNNQSETSHLNSLTFDILRPRFIRSNSNSLTNNTRPQTVPIFVPNQNSNFNPLHSFNNNNFSAGSRNYWNTESLLQNIEGNISQSTPPFIPYNDFSSHVIRRVTEPGLSSVASQETASFVPTSRFRALPFVSISSVSLPPIKSFDSVMAPLTIPDSSSSSASAISLPSLENSDNDGIPPLTANANIITISVSVQTDPTESTDQKATIKSPKRKRADEELPKNLRKKIRKTNNDKISVIDDEKCKVSEEPEEPKERSVRRSARIANDQQKRIVFYEALSQLSKKKKRTDNNCNNDKLESDEHPKKRKGRPRKNEICRSRGKQYKATSSRKLQQLK